MKNKREIYIFGLLLVGIICCLFVVFTGLTNKQEHIHCYDGWVFSINPTCSEKGLRERYCRCGHKQESEADALGHEYVRFDAKPADCTSGGHVAYVSCARCGYSTYEETEALGHSLGEWRQTKGATCADFGEEERLCVRGCGFSETRQTEKLAHSMSVWTVELEASCTADGIKSRRCLLCTAVETMPVAASGHDFGAWVTVTAPDCVTDGLEKRVCSHDETHTETRGIDKTGHAPSDWISEKPSSCTEDGTEAITCSVCFLCLDTRVIKATGHDFGDWELAAAPTCSSFGSEKRICVHDKTHYEVRSVDKTSHSESEWITEKLPACDTEGVRRKECTECGITLDRESVAAFGHDFESRFDEAAHFLKCLNCEAETDNVPHVWGDNACTVCEYDAGGVKGLEWELGPEGTYYILTGLGSVNFADKEIPELHNGIAVTAVGGLAFNGFSGSSIAIPQFITAIGHGAFYGCKNLKELKLPFIGANKAAPLNFGYFFGSENLEDNSSLIPQSLKTVEILSCIQLGKEAFKNCANIEKIILPDELEIIGDECFYNCSALSAIVLPSGLRKIGSGAFWACGSLKEADIPSGVEEIGAYAFYGTSEDIRITFSDTNGWALYDGENRVSDIPEGYFSGEGVKAFAKYMWKRENQW